MSPFKSATEPSHRLLRCVTWVFCSTKARGWGNRFVASRRGGQGPLSSEQTFFGRQNLRLAQASVGAKDAATLENVLTLGSPQIMARNCVCKCGLLRSALLLQFGSIATMTHFSFSRIFSVSATRGVLSARMILGPARGSWSHLILRVQCKFAPTWKLTLRVAKAVAIIGSIVATKLASESFYEALLPRSS